jgi:flagellar motor switch/type III secretory pathway protein FliN
MTTRHQLRGMSRGDAWMPGEGWMLRCDAGGRLEGDVLLVAPGSSHAVTAKLLESGEIVIASTQASPLDIEVKMDGTAKQDEGIAADAVLEAPVVVRVELGAVTLSAREWGGLAPGDVIATGKRVAEPVVLRVGGVEVARGDLVDIEGELGVRIRERVTP